MLPLPSYVDLRVSPVEGKASILECTLLICLIRAIGSALPVGCDVFVKS